MSSEESRCKNPDTQSMLGSVVCTRSNVPELSGILKARARAHAVSESKSVEAENVGTNISGDEAALSSVTRRIFIFCSTILEDVALGNKKQKGFGGQ